MDIYAQKDHPVRDTVSDIGLLLLASLLNLNDKQTGVINAVFKFANDNNLLGLDIKDLQRLLRFDSENATKLKAQYSNISAASVGAIQRAVFRLEPQGVDIFFGKPRLDLNDMIQTVDGQGVATFWPLIN